MPSLALIGLYIEPNDGGAWYNKGVALELLGRNTEARTCFDKAKELGYTG